MNDFLTNPVTLEELLKWQRCKWRNPRTKRSMKHSRYDYTRTKLYIYLSKNYSEKFPSGFDIFDSLDNKDPVTLENFYSIENDEYNLLYKNLDDLIVYQELDSKNNIFIRCLKKETISYLKNYNITKHPVSQIDIPKEVYDSVEKKAGICDSELTIKEKSLQVFQIFNNISIFIDFNLFLNLNKQELCKLNYELSDFYYKNLSDDQRIIIDKEDGNKLFKLKNDDFDDVTSEFIQFYLLNQIEIVIGCNNEDVKLMANYIILGGLSLVIDEVKEEYENFSFSF